MTVRDELHLMLATLLPNATPGQLLQFLDLLERLTAQRRDTRT